MGDSPTEEDVERVDSDYVNPSSTSRDEIRADLEAEGIDGGAADTFEDRLVNADDVVDAVEQSRGEREVTTREDVGSTVDSLDRPRNQERDPSLVDDASQEIGAPTESALGQARAQAAQNVDEDGVVRSDPSLDPLASGDEGREIGEVSEITEATGGRGGGMREGVEPTGSGRGTYYFEDGSGNRYPVAEVDL